MTFLTSYNVFSTLYRLTITFLIGLFFTAFSYSQNFTDFTQKIVNETIEIEMVAIEGGEFSMGALKDDLSRKEDEKPIHQVHVNDFWMGKYEITWEQYDAFVFGNFDVAQFKDASKLQSLGITAISGATTPYVDMSFGMGKEKKTCGEYDSICGTHVLQMADLKNRCFL